MTKKIDADETMENKSAWPSFVWVAGTCLSLFYLAILVLERSSFRWMWQTGLLLITIGLLAELDNYRIRYRTRSTEAR